MTAYFDWAATAPADGEILEESLRISLSCYANPSSVHAEGKKAAELLASARSRAARCLRVPPETLYFTSGGTESDHLPLLALLERPVRGTIAISAIEHPAIVEQAKSLDRLGWKILTIPTDRNGFVTEEAVLATVREDTAYVAVMAVNNETGAIQPVEKIADTLRRRFEGKKKPHFHVDAVQAIGKTTLCVSHPGIDSVAISAHKIRGPRGIGLLYLAHKIEPFIRGGGQESGIRPGTENVAGAEAIARCLEAIDRDRERGNARETMANIIGELTAIPGVSAIPSSRGADDERFSPYVAQFTNSSIPGEVFVRALSDRGVYISTGSACSSKKKTRPVLDSMRIAPDAQRNAFRVSIGFHTDGEEVHSLVNAVRSTLETL